MVPVINSKLSKDQVKLLEVWTSLKIFDILPQAAKIGIPAAEVRKYLRKEGLEYLVEEWKDVGLAEFHEVMVVANRQYQAAVQKYLAVLERAAPVDKANPDPDLTAAQAEMKSLGDHIVWMVGGLLEKGTTVYGISARRAAKELLSKPKRSKGRKA